jgi:hypothetical protein
LKSTPKPRIIQEKAVSRKARQVSKGKSTCCQALTFHLLGLGFYHDKHLEFLCDLRLEAPTFGAPAQGNAVFSRIILQMQFLQ